MTSDQETHRADAAAAQALGHPQWRARAGVDAFDHAAEVARRISAGVQIDREHGIDRGRHRRGVEPGDFAAHRSSDVVGDAAHAEAVGAIGGELDLDAGVGQAEVVGQRCADRGIVGQLQQAGSVVVETQFPGRAQHAVRLDAAQLCRLDRELTDLGADGRQRRDQARARVRRAAHDLQRRGASGIDLANLQAIGLGMPVRRHDTGDNHAIERFTERGHVLDLEADRGQHLGQALAGGVGGNMLAEPVF